MISFLTPGSLRHLQLAGSKSHLCSNSIPSLPSGGSFSLIDSIVLTGMNVMIVHIVPWYVPWKPNLKLRPNATPLRRYGFVIIFPYFRPKTLYLSLSEILNHN